MSRRQGRKAPLGSLRAATSPNDKADRTAVVIEAVVADLTVACACGKGTRKFPTADVRAGRCQWRCGRRGCEPST